MLQNNHPSGRYSPTAATVISNTSILPLPIHSIDTASLAPAILTPHVRELGSKSQPRLLALLMARMKSELEHLGNPPIGDPLRLQVCYEIFETFIRNFKTYEPILSDIKVTYDKAIDTLRNTISRLEPYRTKVEIFQYEAAQEQEAQRQEFIKDLGSMMARYNTLRDDKDALEAELGTLKSHVNVLVEELRIKDATVTEDEFIRKEYSALREKFDALETKYVEETTKNDQELEYQTNMLQKQLVENKRLEKELMKAQKEAMLVQEDIEAKFRVKLSRLQEDLHKVKDSLSSMKSEYEKCAYSLKMKTAIIKNMEQHQTVFPDWDLIIYSCPGSIQEWVGVCKDFDCNNSIIALMKELSKMKTNIAVASKTPIAMNNTLANRAVPGEADSGVPNYMLGLGIGPKVPRFLRYTGKIKTRRITQSEASELIQDVWNSKIMLESSGKCPVKPISEFFYTFLKKRFGNADDIFEWAYNLYAAAKQYQSVNADCQLFFEALEGLIGEEVYHDVQETISHLKTAFHKIDVRCNSGQILEAVPFSECQKLFKAFWPGKSDSQIQLLEEALDSDITSERVNYLWVFDSKLNGSFLNLVKWQELELRKEYVQSLRAYLDTVSKDDIFTVQEYRKALSFVDPGKPKRSLDIYIIRGMGLVDELPQDDARLDADTFIRNLKSGVLWKGMERRNYGAVLC